LPKCSLTGYGSRKGRNIKVTDAEREQIKLRAAALDRASTSCTTIGVLGPLAGAFGAATSATEASLFVASFLYLRAALILHYAAIYIR
jgi:hypothetical protein